MWENTVQLGAAVDTGNNPSKTFLGKYSSEHDVAYPDYPWGYTFHLTGRRATARGVETARQYQSDARAKYLFTRRVYLYGKVNYIYNVYDTYDISVRDSAGLGYIFFDNETQKLTIEAGPGSMHQRIAGPQTWQNQMIGHAEGNYHYHFHKNAEFTQTAVVDSGQANTAATATSAIKTKLMQHIALQFSFEVNYNSTIPVGSSNTKHTDTATNVTLIYTL